MAELATIARPYAEALMRASQAADSASLAAQIGAIADVAADPQMRQYADNPKATAQQVFDLLVSVADRPASASGTALGEPARNLLRMVLENGRIAVLPEIARQFQALVDERSGTSQAVIESAFPLSDAQLADVQSTMERRFKRKLEASVVVVPELIGGVRVSVGDEVLDTSVRARLDQMKAALTA